MADRAMNGLTRDAAHSVWMKCPVVHHSQLQHLAWRRIPSHCYTLYVTHFVSLGYFTHYKFRLHASTWIYPTAVYIKSDSVFLKTTVLPAPHHHPLDCLPPNDELNQGPMSQGRKTTAE